MADRSGETVHYCVLDRDATVLVYRAKGTQLVAVDFQIGDRSPLHCTSIGKALLAYQDARAIDEVISRVYRESRSIRLSTLTNCARSFATCALRFRIRRPEFHDEYAFASPRRCSKRTDPANQASASRGRARATPTRARGIARHRARRRARILSQAQRRIASKHGADPMGL